jgi:D-amino-acid dehydrogenase
MWSLELLKQLKVQVDVQPGKGYSFKVKTALPIHYPALLADANVAVTPLDNGITQFGGGMEIGFSGKEIVLARIRQIIKGIGNFYPSEKGLLISEQQIWHGHRPCSFDGLPYIGRVPAYQNVFVGTGHSMMGVTLAPATGMLLGELISGEKTSLELKPFRVGR